MVEPFGSWIMLCYLLLVHGLGRVLHSIHELDPSDNNTVNNFKPSSFNRRVQLWQGRLADIGDGSLRAGQTSRSLYARSVDQLHLRWLLLVHAERRAIGDSQQSWEVWMGPISSFGIGPLRASHSDPRQRCLHQLHIEERELEVHYLFDHFIWRNYLGLLPHDWRSTVLFPKLWDWRCLQEPILDQPRGSNCLHYILHARREHQTNKRRHQHLFLHWPWKETGLRKGLFNRRLICCREIKRGRGFVLVINFANSQKI